MEKDSTVYPVIFETIAECERFYGPILADIMIYVVFPVMKKNKRKITDYEIKNLPIHQYVECRIRFNTPFETFIWMSNRLVEMLKDRKYEKIITV